MTRALGLAYGIWCLVAASTWAAIVGTIGILPFVVVPRGRRERYTMTTGVLWARTVIAAILFARPTVTGEVALRDPARGALVVSNHRSWLDTVLLVAYTRSQGLGKSQIKYIPFIGLFGWLIGAVYFDRKNPDARKQARNDVLWMVKQGNRIHVYPEGTRSLTSEVAAKVHLTLVMDCWEAKLPVVPCAVWGTERTLPADHTAVYVGQRSRLDIGVALYPEDFPDAGSFADAVWKDVVARVERLKVEP